MKWIGWDSSGAPPENFISWHEVFGDPVTDPNEPKEGYKRFWEYIEGLGLRPRDYEAVEAVDRYGWYLVRRDRGEDVQEVNEVSRQRE